MAPRIPLRGTEKEFIEGKEGWCELMGVTISCKKTMSSCDLGYGGFNRFRRKVAELHSKDFGYHYNLLSTPEIMMLSGERRKEYYDTYNKITEKMITDKRLNIKVADFCFQSDCGGRIRYGACKVIYDIVKDYDDNVIYGYAGREDKTMFRDLKKLLLECYENKCNLVWN